MAFTGQLPETNSANSKETHVSMTPTAKLATIIYARGEFGFSSLGFCSQVGLEFGFLLML